MCTAEKWVVCIYSSENAPQGNTFRHQVWTFVHFLNVCGCPLFWGKCIAFIMLSRKPVTQKGGRETLVCVTLWADCRGKVPRPGLPEPVGFTSLRLAATWRTKMSKMGWKPFPGGSKQVVFTRCVIPSMVYTRNWQLCSVTDRIVNILDSVGQTLLQLLGSAFASQ